MNQSFKAVVLTHRSAPLPVRELLALDEAACRQLLRTLRDALPLTDLLVLSTCNRTEIYYSAPQDYTAAILAALGQLKGLADITRYQCYFVSLTTADEAVQHLFEVALGLDAQVVADQQISEQVKRAYQWSADADLAGPFLHRLLHTIFFAHKRVQQETSFRNELSSTVYASLELVEQLTTHLTAPRVLVVGLGEIGADVARHLRTSTRFSKVILCNPTRATAEVLAQQYQLQVLDFADLVLGLQEVDVVICSVAAATPVITHALVEPLNLLSHKYFVDLALPRSIEAAVETVPGVLLYSLDAIQSRASVALTHRLAAVSEVRAIIAESVTGLREWSSEIQFSGTIQKLKQALEQLRQEEMRRFTKKVRPEEAAMMEELTQALMQKVLKQPAIHLKAACRRGETGSLVEVLTELFDLEKQSASISLW